MKQKGILLLLLIFQIVSCSTTKKRINITGNEIFRYINIGFGRQLQLGDEITFYKNLLINTDSGYKLRGGPYGDAKEIYVFVNEKEIISGFKFIYGEDVRFEEKASSYQESLGNSITMKNKAIWRDGRTEFIIQQTKKGKVFAALLDKNY